ncbi:uncharacterized protein LOC134276321 [Saccostrea cucullata]|uniref:uncharacterized protein LOC134276321 n=1 Tax=Saccostrea cuccullata TaxID=36930 RepID=UPI002ED3E1F4
MSPCDLMIPFLLPFLLFSALRVQAKVKPYHLPDSLFNCFHTFSNESYFQQLPAEKLSATCLMRYMWSDVGINCHNMTQHELDFVGELLGKFLDRRKKRQTNRRRRREYRSLSEEERTIYHNAVRSLKSKSPPRNYDTIARYHEANVGKSAYGGPNFPGWHRVYLLIYEEALIEASGGQLQALPYIDWRLDSRLSESTQSVLWTPQFLGTGNGLVNNGPFANWKVDGSSLIRNVGLGSQLTPEAEIQRLYNINSVRRFGTDLEFLDITTHSYIGGLMLDLRRATFDPVYFMHHCFIDYLWWRYQCPNNRCISARFKYPGTSSDGLHAPNRYMDNLTFQNQKLRNRRGYDQEWLNYFTYEDSPAECTSGCSSLSNPGALDCTLTTCKSARAGGSTDGSGGGGEGTDYYDNYDDGTLPRKRKTIPQTSIQQTSFNNEYFICRPVQNIFTINCQSNSNQWGFIPVKVVNVWSRKQVYNSYPVRTGKILVSSLNDIYDQLPGIEKIDNRTKPGNPKRYQTCTTDDSRAFRVTINSYGLNYYGFYQDYAIMDNRAPLYSAMTYIAVRRPTKYKQSLVYLTSFDNCGRFCTPRCLVPGSKPPRYRSCTGAIKVDDSLPRGYGTSYDDAVLLYYSLHGAGSCPHTIEQSIPIIFYCNKANTWLPRATNSNYFG